MTDYTINPDRGEVAIKLDGKIYPMAPTYEAQVAIEQTTGVSIEELLMRMRRQVAAEIDHNNSPTGVGLKLFEMVVVITHCVRAAGKSRNDKDLQSWSTDRVGELVVADRSSFNEPVLNLLMNALFGGADPKKALAGSPAPESPRAES